MKSEGLKSFLKCIWVFGSLWGAQDERWMVRYNEVVKLIETTKRRPSKYVDSERGLRNWDQQLKKLMDAGALEGQRLKMFNELLALGEKYKLVY